MVSQPLKATLPSTEELPCSDDTPVDNEDQNLLPNLLLFALTQLWAERLNWFFGVDMAVYHTTNEIAINPLRCTGWRGRPTGCRLVNPTGCRRSAWGLAGVGR